MRWRWRSAWVNWAAAAAGQQDRAGMRQRNESTALATGCGRVGWGPHSMSDSASSEFPSFTVAGNIVDVPNRRIFAGVVHVHEGRIERIVPDSNAYETFLM